MSSDVDLAELVMLEPDERLLHEDVANLPAAVGRPEPLPADPSRRRIVGVGATLTGVTLIGGLALIVLGVAELIAGGSTAVMVAAFVLGIVLVSTHWGWVHVAELTANNAEARQNASLLERRRAWLRMVTPYPRWEVDTSTDPDGSIAVTTIYYRPVPHDEQTFTFTREEVAREVHSGDEPAAAVTERAELLRRRTAADTARERERYEAAHAAYQEALLASGDEQERIAAVRAASEALSDQINANLRDPPLAE